MTADPLAGLGRFEADLWKIADNPRANSNLASNEYCLPILGLIFLRHATNRYYEALEAITYYKDPHELAGKCDFVMANQPFNVDEVDAETVKGDKRLPFGLPSVNKAKKVSNANYLWLSYFYGYLNGTGRAGVVMSSQASSAGRDEAKVRRKLVETGAVDVMIDIRGNFFYTRTVPCQLWFFDRAKEQDRERADRVLMLDARNIHRKVSPAIYDFSPEQQKNFETLGI